MREKNGFATKHLNISLCIPETPMYRAFQHR